LELPSLPGGRCSRLSLDSRSVASCVVLDVGPTNLGEVKSRQARTRNGLSQPASSNSSQVMTYRTTPSSW
jgi:hypothetical protein